jgi:hypothetical protein
MPTITSTVRSTNVTGPGNDESKSSHSSAGGISFSALGPVLIIVGVTFMLCIWHICCGRDQCFGKVIMWTRDSLVGDGRGDDVQAVRGGGSIVVCSITSSKRLSVRRGHIVGRDSNREVKDNLL